MAISNAQKIAKAKYQQSSRTLIAADVSKAKGEFYRQSAKDLDLSLSMLIQSGIEEFISRHSADSLSSLDKTNQAAEIFPARHADKLSAADKKLVEEFNKLPVEIQKAITKLIASINTASKHSD